MPPQIVCVLAQQQVPSDSALGVDSIELEGLVLSESSVCWHSDEPQQGEQWLHEDRGLGWCDTAQGEMLSFCVQ